MGSWVGCGSRECSGREGGWEVVAPVWRAVDGLRRGKGGGTGDVVLEGVCWCFLQLREELGEGGVWRVVGMQWWGHRADAGELDVVWG